MNKQEIVRFFDALAATWDDELHPDDAKMQRILDAAKVKAGSRVLDIACGTGVMFPFYLQRGAAHITGADISEKMASVCREKFRGDARIDVLVADAETYAFDTGYDVCMIFNAFPHFCNRETLLNNLKKALVSGGTLTVAHDWGRKALDKHHEDTAGEVSSGLMPEEELAALFEQCGFTDVYAYADEGIYIVSGTKQ